MRKVFVVTVDNLPDELTDEEIEQIADGIHERLDMALPETWPHASVAVFLEGEDIPGEPPTQPT